VLLQNKEPSTGDGVAPQINQNYRGKSIHVQLDFVITQVMFVTGSEIQKQADVSHFDQNKNAQISNQNKENMNHAEIKTPKRSLDFSNEMIVRSVNVGESHARH
jgi:stalled ribosome rescue protein Dom34